jgi:protein-tyrosine sulfotransferase
MTSRPLFVLCGPRRGSTLLRYILDTHSQIASPGEIELGALCCHLEDVIRQTQTDGAVLNRFTAESLAETGKVVGRIMSAYAARKGKRIWCDKSIDNLDHLVLLQKTFPDARFICLHRDCLDVVHSCLECSRHGFMPVLSPYAVRNPENLIAAMMTAWLDHTGVVLEFERRNPESCFRIRYEDLVAAPEDYLRPLLAFAGVEWEDGLLDAVFSTPHDPGGGDPKIQFSRRIEARVGGGQLLYLGEVSENIKRAVDELSAQLAYPPLGPGRQLPRAPAADPGAAGAEESARPGAAPERGEQDGGGAPADRTAAGARHFVEAFLQPRLRERAELAAAIQGSCRILLEGQGGGHWKLEFGGGVPSIAAEDGAADCSIIMSVAEFEAIIAGRADPMVALWNGKVTIEGNPELASQVAQLIYVLSQDAAS